MTRSLVIIKHPKFGAIYILSPRKKLEVLSLNTAVNMFVNKPVYLSKLFIYYELHVSCWAGVERLV